MGGKDLNRHPRLHSVRETPRGWIRLATCNARGHKGPLPVQQLIRKYGELEAVEFALVTLKCTAFGERGATATIIRLCEPGCPRQRG